MMLAGTPMESALHFESVDNNPDLLNVSVENGILWLSEDVIEDIREFTGCCPETGDVREMLRFISDECEKLQYETISERCLDFNFRGYCLLKAIEHAIETKMHGRDFVGGFSTDWDLNEAFVCDGPSKSRFVLH